MRAIRVRGMLQRGVARRGTGWGLGDSLVLPPYFHHLLRHASIPAGAADLSSLSLAVSRTTGEKPSTVPAHLHAQDGAGGILWRWHCVHLCLGVLRRSTSAFLSLYPSLPVEMGSPDAPTSRVIRIWRSKTNHLFTL